MSETNTFMHFYPLDLAALSVTNKVSVKNKDLILLYLNIRSFVPKFLEKLGVDILSVQLSGCVDCAFGSI